MKYVRNSSHGAARSPSSSTTYFSSIWSRSCFTRSWSGTTGPAGPAGAAARAGPRNSESRTGRCSPCISLRTDPAILPHAGRGVATPAGPCQPRADRYPAWCTQRDGGGRMGRSPGADGRRRATGQAPAGWPQGHARPTASCPARAGPHDQPVAERVHPDRVAVLDLARQDLLGQPVADGRLDQPAQRPGAVRRVVALVGEPGQGRVGDLQGEPAVGEPLGEAVDLEAGRSGAARPWSARRRPPGRRAG